MMERVALSAGRCGSECVEYSYIYVLHSDINVFQDYMNETRIILF